MTSADPIQAFESALATRMGQSQVIAVAYARLGLRLLLEALGLRAGDEVILSGLTCRVVVLAVQSAGFRPVYADVLSSGALNMDADSVIERISSRTRAIVFQHTYGTNTGLDAVAQVARERGIPLIEDCAHCLPPATGAPGAGTRGIASIWSHNFRKPMPVGAGGSVATSDEPLAALVRRARDAGAARSPRMELQWELTRASHATMVRPSTYWPLWSLARRLRGDHRQKPLQDAIYDEVNSLPVRISARQAEWGLRGLRDADRRVTRSGELALTYDEALGGLSTIRQVPGATATPLYYYPVLARRKAAVLDAARRRGLELIAWPLSTPIYPIERQTELAQSEYALGSCPNAEELATVLCGLPVDLMTTTRGAQSLITLLRQTDGGGSR